MVNYAKSKIYKIEPIVEHDEGDIYIGSTTKNYLSDRMSCHRNHYKLWKDGKHHKIMVFDIFDKYGVDNCKILLIETFPCNTKDELASREGYHINSNKCVNKCVAGRTKKQSDMHYYESNNDKIKIKHKQYREINKETIRSQKNLKHTCDCGGTYTNANKAQHTKSNKHQDYLTNL